jgi:hypothetical protein
MRIKHWQGYGSVNAKVKEKGFTYSPQGMTNRYVVIEVRGNHEYGLEVYRDNYTVAKWLGKVGKFTFEELESYTSHSYYVRNDVKGIDEECCNYTIILKDIR